MNNISWSDFLGIPIRKYGEWRTYENAEKYVHSLDIGSVKEWYVYVKSKEKPNDIPASPHVVYKNRGWVSWVKFLGDKHRRGHWRSYEGAKSYANALNLSTKEEWGIHCANGNLPVDIPKAPHLFYKNNGWESWGKFLGTGFIHFANREYRSYKEAEAFVHRLKLRNGKEWHKYCKSGKKPIDIPSAPHLIYKSKGWKGMGVWLGTGNINNRDKIFLSYEKSERFVCALGLIGESEWRMYCKSGRKPHNIPRAPQVVYKGRGWESWGKFLGTGNVALQSIAYRSYQDAEKFVQNLDINNRTEWHKYCKSGKKPIDIPSYPNQVYKNKGWVDMGTFLGNGNVSNRNKVFWSYTKSEAFVHKLKLKNEYEWRKYCKSGKKPPNIPACPSESYKGKGWKGMGAWLGTGNIAGFRKVFRSYKKAERFIHAIGLKTWAEWRAYVRTGDKPNDIPSAPNRTYKGKGWIDFSHWLGTNK
ncbi:MAG: integrase repeat-containing protein [Synergistaceae bacterium]